jgi:tetratricopeptide (TPR) repeat protein
MHFLVRPICGALVLLLMVGLGGCLPSGTSQMEEEKEPHFLAGRSCINSMDYKGAIEEFEKTLEANPHSASAHFQLGWLYEERDPDPAAAIYHYEQFLKLRPKADNAEVIRQHIINCKQDLAKTILVLPVTPGMQHEFEQLADENKRLRAEVERWRAYASRLQLPTNPSVSTAGAVKAAPNPAMPASAPSSTGQTLAAANPQLGGPAAGPGTARAYVVKAGDSPYSIARRNGV